MMEQQQERQPEIEFAPEDLALATIPGANFDPRERAFSTEELKPQPIIRKRKMQQQQQPADKAAQNKSANILPKVFKILTCLLGRV